MRHIGNVEQNCQREQSDNGNTDSIEYCPTRHSIKKSNVRPRLYTNDNHTVF